MQSVVLISAKNDFLYEISKEYNNEDILYLCEENRLNIETGKGRIYITSDNNIADDYDSYELDLLNGIFTDKVYFYLVNYSHNEALDNVIMKIHSSNSIYIDDDKGSIISIDEYKTRLQE